MAWVEPNTEVRVLRGIGLDRGFQHTVYWDNDEDQSTYFKSKTAYTFNPQTYQRTDRGTIRVRETYDHLMTCNYMMFRNLSHGAKWFYAFIDNCEYVNENTTEIYYTVDPMQSWQFQYEMKPCYVEREHTASDNFGENQMPENLEVGEYIVFSKNNIDFEPYSLTDSDCTVLLFYNGQDGKILRLKSGSNTEYELVDPNTKQYTIINNMPTAFNFIGFQYFNSNTYASENSLMMQRLWSAINTLTANSQILAIYVVPTDLYRYVMVQDITYETQPLVRNYGKPTGFKYIQNPAEQYIPKNMKMWQYPYSFIKISNNKGDSKDYRWEYFNPENPMYDATFEIAGTIMPSPLAVVYPCNYKGVSKFYELNNIIPDYLPVQWSFDSYTRWWTENKTQYSTAMAFNVIRAVLATINLGADALALTKGSGEDRQTTEDYAQDAKTLVGSVGGFLNSIENITRPMAQKSDAMNKVDTLEGGVADYSLKIQEDRMHHTLYKYTISGEMAELIDKVFSQFGYTTHNVKIPNRNVRRHWCYTKTQNCIIDGDLPMAVNEKIESIYDKGITFWLDPEHIGDYEYYHWNNEVITP